MLCNNMSFISVLEKLKHLINSKDNTLNFNLINIQYNSNNNTQKYQISGEEQKLTLFLNNLTDHEKRALKPILIGAVDDGVCLLEEKSKAQTEDIVVKEKSENEVSLLEFYKKRLTHDDYMALRASLFLRSRFQEHADKREIDKLKSDITKKYGKRGRNISDLCSADYFEVLMDLPKEIPEKDFPGLYEAIVGKGLLTIFVSEGKSPIQITQDIEKKMKKLKRYGAKGVIVVHGIGKRNIETIYIAISDIFEKYPDIKFKMYQENNVVSVSITF